MVNHYQQQGAVLAMVLLLMVVLTGLVLTALSNTVLDNKMSQAFQYQLTAFTVAEAELLALEANLQGQTLTVPTQGVSLTSNVVLQGDDSCKRPWYLITVNARYQSAQITLQSAYKQAREPPLPECAQEQFKSQRLWWRQLDVSF